MSTSDKPIFLVSCATGHQGCNVICALLKDNKYRVRGIVRDDSTEKALHLKEKGVELIKGDITKCDTLKSALQGVEVFYAYTDYYDHNQRGRENEIGTMMVDAAKQAGVKHFIWSWLPNTKKISNGKYNVPLFTHKGEVGEYALQQLPTTLVGLAFYYQNFLTLFAPKINTDGSIVYSFPHVGNLPGFDTEELGDAIVSIANHREEWLGKTIPLFGDSMPIEQYIDLLATKEDVKLNLVSLEEFLLLDIERVDEWAEMFAWINEFGYFGPDVNLELRKKLCPKLKTFKQFVESAKVVPK